MKICAPIVTAVALLPLVGGCHSNDHDHDTHHAVADADAPEAPSAEASDAPEAAPAAPAEAVPAAVTTAVLGKPAPDFVLADLDGNEVRLSDHKGTVVLEWFNPGCPFVVRAHEQGELATWPNEAGVTWLAINSGAPGKQGHGADLNKGAVAKWKMNYPLLIDEDGAVGRAYSAKTTPHMYVIHDGILVYAGAIDDDMRADKGDARINYVAKALAEIAAGEKVSTPETRPYGCSVKY